MDPLSDHFIHYPEYKAAICRQCQFAVVRKHIRGHLSKKHREISPTAQEEIVQAFQAKADIADNVEDIVDPPSGINAVPELPIYSDGFQCIASGSGQQCGYICRGRRCHIQRHCREQHGWKRKRGTEVPWVEEQLCQQLSKIGSGPRYFIVKSESPTPSIDIGEALFSRIQEERKARHTQQQIQAGIPRSVANPWLAFTGWTIHLAGFTPTEMLATIMPAVGEEESHSKQGPAPVGDEEDEEDEVGLAEACHATRRLIRQAFRVCRTQIVGRTALEYVNRRECGGENNETPFYGEQQVKTIRKYSGHWVKILRYIWRTHRRETRPQYVLSDEQRQQFSNVQTAAVRVVESSPIGPRQIKGKRQLVRVCLHFWLAMFDHPLKDCEFESGVISGLAVLGLDSQNEGWVPAVNYTPILAAIITTLRAMVVYRAHGIRQTAIQCHVADGKTIEQAKAAAPSVFEGVQSAVDRFMTLTRYGGSPMPLDRIFHQKTYGMKIRFTTKAPGQVLWEGERVTVGKAKFTVDQIRTVVHGLNESIRQRLKHELMWFPRKCAIRAGDWRPMEMPFVGIQQLYDDHVEVSPRWNFIQDYRNTWPVDGTKWLWTRLFHTQAEHWIDSGGSETIRWKGGVVESYFRQIRQFKEELMVLVHLSAGAPARATELISIQHQNGEHSQGQRGVFIQDGMVAFVTQYHKGYSASKRVKIVHRFVPKEVGEMVVYYLWLVEPFVQQLQAATRQQFDPSPFIWEPKPEEQWMDGEVEEEGANGDEEVEEEGIVPEWSEDEGDEWLIDVPIQRDERAAANSDGFWDTDRVRRVMHRETEARIGVKIGVATWRNAYPAIQRELCRDHGVREALDRIYDGDPQHSQVATAMQQVQEIQARQSGHSRQMEEMIYGLLMSESPFSTMSEREQFRQVSVDWHRVLRFPSAWEGPRVAPDIAQRMKRERDDMQIERQERIRGVDVAAELRRMYGPAARFQGIQQVALEAIVAGTPYVVAVMRTGGGKSALFMLPAAGSPRGLTVVIVPVVALRQDLHERCNRTGIRSSEWDGERPPYDSQIVFVTPESAVSMAFSQFLAVKQANGQLERIVVDECHMILESHGEWRPRVLQLCEMAQQGVQVVYLTATLPPHEESMFLVAIGVEARDIRMIREPTGRANIAYAVVEYEREEEDAAVGRLVAEKKAQYPEGQIIVYCPRVEQARRLAQVLGCSVYHRGVGSAAEKRAILRKLTGEHERVFTATNALGLGIDAPRIRVVIHVGIREQIKQYAQESGRAGRDGQSSEAIIMQSTWKDPRTGEHRQEQGWRTEKAMGAFLRGDQCRRIPLDQHMDGRRDRRGCEADEQRCDVCGGQSRARKRRRTEGAYAMEPADVDEPVAEPERAAEQERAIRQQMQSRREQLEREQQEAAGIRGRQEHTRTQTYVGVEGLSAALARWQQDCCICRASGQETEHEPGSPCPSRWRGVVQKAREAVEKISLQRHTGCYWCQAPQAVCHQWENISHGGPMRFRRVPQMQCQFRGVIRDAVAAMLVIGGTHVSGWIDEEVQKAGMVKEEGNRWEVYTEWMGRKVIVNGLEMSGLCRVFWEFGIVAEVGRQKE